ncbi:MAG: ComEC/Rec2 family competence protein [Rhodospirillales bacterium]|nr:ComEC/Rec2 family competence protein [Rhodospirillales bacterium]
MNVAPARAVGNIPRIGRFHAFAGWIGASLLAERERWVLWLPVFVGIGIGIYFCLPSEPRPWSGAAALFLGFIALLLVTGSSEHGQVLRPVAVCVVAAILAVAVGFAAAQIKANALGTLTLEKAIGPTVVHGRVGRVEHFPSGLRVTIDQLAISRLAHDKLPERIRLRLRGSQPAIRPGDEIELLAMVMPPPAPSVPGGYDFQREAYFRGLGGVGYSVGSARVLSDDHPQNGVTTAFARARFTIAERVRTYLDGATAAVTTALLTGETRSIPDAAMAAIRNSGLAHLLSISGLHIGLVAGIIFVLTRSALALIPALALRFPIKKWAALASVIAAGGYTLLASAPVPAQRSFVMIAIVLLAILVDRQGISMRLVAAAALIVLITQPESMLGPSFQMSFAAVLALIAGYEELHVRRRQPEERHGLPVRLLLYFAGVVFSTLLASSATAPFAAYHFNRFQLYGIVANMLAVPLTGFWVMPWAVAAVLLMPFGLEAFALVPMGWGVAGIIHIAEDVAAWPGAVILLPTMPLWGLVVITFGGLWICLWQRPWRWLGGLGIAAGLVGMLFVEPPDVFVDAKGQLFAVRDDDGGLMFSSKSAARSARESWIRRVGDEAASGYWRDDGGKARDGAIRCDELGCVYRRGGHVVAFARRGEALIDDCTQADVIISLAVVRRRCASATTVVDRAALLRNGTHVLWLDAGTVRLESVNGRRGNRPWVPVLADESADTDADAGDDDADASRKTRPGEHRISSVAKDQPDDLEP